jgi:hypothetical protein
VFRVHLDAFADDAPLVAFLHTRGVAKVALAFFRAASTHQPSHFHNNTIATALPTTWADRSLPSFILLALPHKAICFSSPQFLGFQISFHFCPGLRYHDSADELTSVCMSRFVNSNDEDDIA